MLLPRTLLALALLAGCRTPPSPAPPDLPPAPPAPAPAPPAAPPSPPAPPSCDAPCVADGDCVVATPPDCGDCVAVLRVTPPSLRCVAPGCRATICDATAFRARCDPGARRCVLAPAR
ncbi:MAG: hypothetical protein U0324_07570 [Polyangiales bacterium]